MALFLEQTGGQLSKLKQEGVLETSLCLMQENANDSSSQGAIFAGVAWMENVRVVIHDDAFAFVGHFDGQGDDAFHETFFKLNITAARATPYVPADSIKSKQKCG